MEKISVPGVGEFTPEELKERVLKAEDYTKKTQAVAEERKALESMKAEMEQKRLALASTQELADALAEKPEFADEVRKLADKYNNPDGSAPTEGSAKADAYAAELKKLAAKIDSFEQRENAKAEEQKTAEAYQLINSKIESAIKKTGVALTDRQKAMVGNDAWSHAAQLAQKGLLNDEAIDAYVKEGVDAIKDPKLTRTAEGGLKQDTTQTGGAAGTGGTQEPAKNIPKIGSKEFSERFKGIAMKFKPK